MATHHKRQHAVPASYLAAWTDPETPVGHEPYVHVYSKDGQPRRPRPPAKIFTETDLYTIKMPAGGRDLRLERGLQQLEDSFVRVRRDFLSARRQIPLIPFQKFLAFSAAMHVRTVKMRDHHQDFWRKALGIMEQVERNMRAATPEQRKAAASLPSLSSGPTFDKDQVRDMVENTMPRILPPMFETEMIFLPFMKTRVLCATGDSDFITSDTPVVWYDPEAHTKPPLWRSPSFSDPRLEITMPVSPRQTLLITHADDYPDRDRRVFCAPIDYVDVDDELVTVQNRRIRFGCHREFILAKSGCDPIWFRADELPSDAWENTNAIEEKDEEE